MNEQLDLVLDRVAEISPSAIWKAWTTPELFPEWFCPPPWKVVEARLDLRPGGLLYTRMKGPEEGQEFDNVGCFLEVIPERRLVWTSALGPDFRPTPHNPHGFKMTAVIELEPVESGTRYRVTVLHADEESRSRHAAMGFETGWSLALDQLVKLMSQA